jgi:hypothetical protein
MNKEVCKVCEDRHCNNCSKLTGVCIDPGNSANNLTKDKLYILYGEATITTPNDSYLIRDDHGVLDKKFKMRFKIVE